MNVSSVKNLNGEVFSAVQDASLTNVVQTNSGNWQDITAYQSNSASYLTAVDLSPYQTIEGMTAYQPVGDYATTAEVDTLSSMLSGAIDYVSANAGDEFPVSADEAIQYVQTNSANIDDTVTSYQTNSGDYLKESELGYNAVDEVSAINGSAIAQYGAEKQWLVHDDTIVHISNSAQYAFGVNLSAVAQLLGVDETVLYSGTEPTSSVSLTETWKNFDRLKIYVQNKSMDNGLNMVEVRPLERDGHTPYYNIIAGFSYGLGTNGMIWQNIIGIATDTTLTNQSAFGFQNSWTATAPTVRKNNTNDLNCILKVIGIGRKEV